MANKEEKQFGYFVKRLFLLIVILVSSKSGSLNNYKPSTATTSSAHQASTEQTLSTSSQEHASTKQQSPSENPRNSSAHQASTKQILSTSSQHASTEQQIPSENPRNVYYINGTIPVVNKWYGWQPEIPKSMDCTWQQCLVKDHNCTTCRDSLEDMKNTTSLDPGKDWVPDVTMLRRMFLDGHDANGNPWPPPLDDELCNVLPKNDSTRELFDVVPIIGAPISREPEKGNNKVLCFIYAMENGHHNKIRSMRETWAPGCDGFLVFSTKSDPRIPAISVPHKGAEKYGNMWFKIRSMFEFVGKHYLSQFDWFYMGGDDLLVFPQNLKNYLATFNSSEPHYLGRRFKTLGNRTGFNTGGAGYALTRPSLQCMLDHYDEAPCNPWKKSSAEDVLTARCLAKACNIPFEDTRDDQMRERFHHWWPEWEYRYKGRLHWYQGFHAEWGLLLGKNCCSPETVNFHYIKIPAMMRYLFHYAQNCNRNL
mmetsp:Transcript_32330/g.78614  ORF Transcript_32330/g.78614 Transcript_32330/m.78614 type:complete len:480 (+) Transcript_32330:73-1512(+)